jgi:hypothetical protein
MLQRGFSRFGGANGEIVEVAPVTLPALSCLKVPVVDDGAERREIADSLPSSAPSVSGPNVGNRFLKAAVSKTGPISPRRYWWGKMLHYAHLIPTGAADTRSRSLRGPSNTASTECRRQRARRQSS